MSQEVNLGLGGSFSSCWLRMQGRRMSTLFSPNVRFELPGDENVLPLVGQKTGQSAVVDFVTDRRTLLEPMKFEVSDVLASNTRAVILVDFATRIKATGRTVVSSAAIILEISDGAVTRFLMIEESFEVSRKAWG